jgi:hypothetical protein
MKHTLFIVSILAAINVFGQTDQITQIELSKVSRGYSEHIRITSDSLFFSSEDRKSEGKNGSYAVAIDPKQWENLVQVAAKLKLHEIDALPSPTMKRASDAAMHSTITIVTNSGQSYSHGYDDEHPHEAIEPLRAAIRELADTHRQAVRR